MQALTGCNTKVTSTRTTAGQFKRQFNGAMEEMSRGFKMQTLTYCDATFMSTRTAAGQFKGQFKGGDGGKFRESSKMQAHITTVKHGH